ncbi:Nif3-like dinuclear metal center hexameric protein [Paenibacillus sp. OV219]|uniref:Nif3-like dinuclear metal center hexameric protein n=1 Tax=Paenibacillus sp. OV219 TaxID=1884377 RepID=UPI0008D7CB3C|nr:Nif3-like dinuclear metal center hexameric protein [Paenibacillus sp. OV219]SEO49062.1 Putative GTP cyclohydrolase 1 type 2, NIF3 family [Paenibacillus sp. OV219]
MTAIVRIRDVIDALGGPVGTDALCFGEPEEIVTGIAVAFTASQQVLEQAQQNGLNLIISHEGLFYSHHHQSYAKLIEVKDPVYEAKLRTIAEHRLAVYCYHDGLHRQKVDGIMEGLLAELGWDAYVQEHERAASVVELPTCTVGELAEELKRKLGIRLVRAAGDLTMTCRRVGVLVGFRGGGEVAIPLFERHQLDAIVYGEGQEWETPEYVRDAYYGGRKKALLVLGHLESEQPGMKLLADRLSVRFPDVPVHYMPVDSLFTVL